MKNRLNRTRRPLRNVFQIAALALVATMSLPAHAAEERAIKSRVAPVYPELAKRMRISGIVKVEATVDQDGKVTAVKTMSGNHVLSPAAEQAVSRWKFVPATDASTVDVEVKFAMAE